MPPPDNQRSAPRARDTGHAAPRRRWLPSASGQRDIVVALALAICFGLFIQVPAWNEYSRFALIAALVDDHTLRIDRYHALTGDKALVNGHYYSDKVPGTALLGAPAYGLVRLIASGSGHGQPHLEQTIAAITFAVAGLPTIALVLLLLRFLRPLVGEAWALAMALGYGLGTIAFPFATMLFGHAASTCLAFAAFFTLWRHGPAGRPWPFMLAGLLAGGAVLMDLPAAIIVAALAIYAWSHDARAPLLLGVGAVPPALLLLGYNWLAFGDPFSLGYANLANQSFAAGMGRGLLGVTLPQPDTLRDLLVGPRGLLRLSPWFALAPLGLLAARRAAWRREVVLCGVVTLAFLLFNAGYYLPFGGWTPGPRFLSPALPFATILVALAPRAFRPLVALQLVVSILLCATATATMPNAPELVGEPLGELWLPRLLSGNLAQTTAWLRWGLHGWQPLAILGASGCVALATLYATRVSSRQRQRATVAGIATLTALALAFGPPLDGAAGLSLRTWGQGPAMRIADAGATVRADATGQITVALWSQLANGDTTRENTEVRFSIFAPSGEEVWAAWHGDVRWRGGERKLLHATWSADVPAPGDYRVTVRVTADGGRSVLAQRDVVLRVQPAR